MRGKTNRNCFGLSHNEMSTYGLYAIIAAGVITGVELITLLSMCLCCRNKLPCCNKDYDELSSRVCFKKDFHYSSCPICQLLRESRNG